MRLTAAGEGLRVSTLSHKAVRVSQKSVIHSAELLKRDRLTLNTCHSNLLILGEEGAAGRIRREGN